MEEGEENFEDKQIIQRVMKEILGLLHELPGYQPCNKVSVTNWYGIDNEEKMFMKVYTDEIL
jgi:hypothetical protein